LSSSQRWAPTTSSSLGADHLILITELTALGTDHLILITEAIGG
jgi:hypothetical protein